MTKCRHGLSEDCPGCMQETIDAAFATCIMIVEEECGLDKKPAQGRDNYVHGKYDVGMAIVDRIKCAQRNPDETKMRVPAQCALERPSTEAMHDLICAIIEDDAKYDATTNTWDTSKAATAIISAFDGEPTTLTSTHRCTWPDCDQPSGHDFCYRHCLDNAGHPAHSSTVRGDA